MFIVVFPLCEAALSDFLVGATFDARQLTGYGKRTGFRPAECYIPPGGMRHLDWRLAIDMPRGGIVWANQRRSGAWNAGSKCCKRCKRIRYRHCMMSIGKPAFPNRVCCESCALSSNPGSSLAAWLMVAIASA